MNSYDVVVIGAGLAGLKVTEWLAARSHKVLLVDCKAKLTENVHTTGIFVKRSFDDFEFPAETLGPVVRDVVLYSPRMRSVKLQSVHDEFRVGRMPLLYSKLLENCRAAGATILLGTRYCGRQQGATGSIVELETGGVKTQVETRFLVGADGATSAVAGDLGLSQNRKWIVGVEEVYHNVPLSGPPVLHCVLHPRLAPGYLAWVAHDGEEVHVGVGGYAREFEPKKALVEFTEMAQQIVPLSQGEIIERRGGRIPVGGVLPKIVNSMGLLVGDAAGAVSPLTAGGLDPCLRLSQLAVDVLHDALTATSQNQDPHSILARYNGRAFRNKFRLRLLMRSAIETVRSERLCEIICWMLRQPGGKQLAAKVFFGRGSFPDVGDHRS